MGVAEPQIGWPGALPIAIGLLAMMYPVLAKVRYTEVGRIAADRRMMATSLILNWIVGPAVMFALAWLLLPDLPAYRTGVILVGLARCIAMVLIWTDLARGDREMAAVLVALNAVFQLIAYAALGVFYLNVLPGWLGLHAESLHVSFALIAVTVVVFLGVPLVAGFLTRTLGERARGREWYETRLLPRIAPIALYGLLFTVVVLFALQGKTITSRPLDVVRIALPLLTPARTSPASATSTGSSTTPPVMAKVVIHLFRSDEDSLSAGSHVAERIRQVAAGQGADLEVYCFGPAQAALSNPDGPARAEYNQQIDDLAAAGVSVGACLNAARRRHRRRTGQAGHPAAIRPRRLRPLRP